MRYSASESKQSYVDFLHSMLEVPSPSYAERELAERLAYWMGELGFVVERDQVGNVIGQLDRGPGPTIMLLGHMDTVAGTVPVRVEGGRLYGRGAVDAKGPLAAMVCAASSTVDFRGQLVVAGVVEEETPCSRGAVEIGLRLPQPDALIVGEPSGADSVVIGYKGKLDLNYEVSCPAAHSTQPADKAVELAVSAWTGLLEVLGPVSHTSFDMPGATLTELSGDAELAAATFDVRTPPGFDVAGCVKQLRRWLTAGTLDVVNAVAACRVPRSDPVVRALSVAVSHFGRRPRCKVKTATSDMNTLAEVWSCPMATYGPGDSQLDHSANENIKIDEYLAGVEVLRYALGRLSADQLANASATAG